MPFLFFRRRAKLAKECVKGCPDCLHEMTDPEVKSMHEGPLLSRLTPDTQERLRKQLADAFAVSALVDGD